MPCFVDKEKERHLRCWGGDDSEAGKE